ncbi:MAG: hypothetical protein LBQ58_09165 [Synergistaceae bacterium]|jgi:hypothetical protein|nr:hypothetical protein [Synergistaceae bacterium]
MRVRLDDVELSIGDDIIQGGKTAIYETAKQSALSKNRVIVNMLIDGESIQDEETFFSLSGGTDVQFISQPIIDLVRESVSEGQRYLPSLISGLQGIATMFEEDRDQDAKISFSQAIDGINWLVSVFDRSCGLLGITSDSFKSGDLAHDFGELNKALEEVASVMGGGKSIRIAYLIRENLLPCINQFGSYWSEVAAHLDSPLQ